MTDKSVIQATYVTYKPVPTRKVLQLVFEVPLEHAPEAHQTLGQPMPDTQTWVAIARLEKQAVEKQKRSWNDMPRSQQAGLACNDLDFQRWLQYHVKAPGEDTADRVRHLCGIQSRADLDKSNTAADLWDKLYSDYQLHRRGAAA